MSFLGNQIIESPFVADDQIVFINLNKDIPPMSLGPGEEPTVEKRIAHILKHGGVVMVKNIGKFKESMGL